MNPVPIPRDLPLPLPAPEPLLVAVLVVFFLMHIFFVNIMVGGTMLTLYYEIRGLTEKRYDELAKALAATVTANKSIAVVLGIGPLLAINTLYTVYFYTANALTGGLWIGIVPLVTAAFVLTYLHKYLWDAMAGMKRLHIALVAASCALFLFIPLIFLANINLMLFPASWGAVDGFVSALRVGNVVPRYVHFLLACPAMTGLFMVWLFRRRNAVVPDGFSKAELIRSGYHWALWPTAVQFLVGPLTLLTLPSTQHSQLAVAGVFGISLILSGVVTWQLLRELRRPDEQVGKRLGAVCATMLAVVALMGVGRHMYREAAIAPHRALVEEKTKAYMQAVQAAQKDATLANPPGAELAARP